MTFQKKAEEILKVLHDPFGIIPSEVEFVAQSLEETWDEAFAEGFKAYNPKIKEGIQRDAWNEAVEEAAKVADYWTKTDIKNNRLAHIRVQTAETIRNQICAIRKAEKEKE